LPSAKGGYVTRLRRKFGVEDELGRYVSALYDMLAGVVGPEKLVLRAGKVNALKMMRSASLPDRLCALQRLVFEDRRANACIRAPSSARPSPTSRKRWRT